MRHLTALLLLLTVACADPQTEQQADGPTPTPTVQATPAASPHDLDPEIIQVLAAQLNLTIAQLNVHVTNPANSGIQVAAACHDYRETAEPQVETLRNALDPEIRVLARHIDTRLTAAFQACAEGSMDDYWDWIGAYEESFRELEVRVEEMR